MLISHFFLLLSKYELTFVPMRILKYIITNLLLGILLLSLSGGIMHFHYCFSTESYSFDFHPASDIHLDQKLCNCDSGDLQRNAHCCSSETEGINNTCCFDLKASFNSDKVFTSTIFLPDLRPVCREAFNLTRPGISEYQTVSTYGYYKFRDHSPPDQITCRILII